MHRATIRIALTLTAILAPVPAGLAQQAGAPPPTQAGRGGRGPAVISPEIQPDGHVVFRIAAPRAETVTLNAGDIPEPDRVGRVVRLFRRTKPEFGRLPSVPYSQVLTGTYFKWTVSASWTR